MSRKNKKQGAAIAAFRRLKQINSTLMAYAPRPVCERLEKFGIAEQSDQSPRHCHVCVLFSDIRGFTELSRILDDAGLLLTVQTSSERQSKVIEAFGGYVDNYAGDGLMAIFEGEDKVAKACDCALELIVAAAQTEDGGSPVSVAVGVHVGDVMMGEVGSSERRSYTAIGETVNVASRLCDHARTPEVITSNAVRMALQEEPSMAFDGLSSAIIPGAEAHMPVYRLRRC